MPAPPIIGPAFDQETDERGASLRRRRGTERDNGGYNQTVIVQKHGMGCFGCFVWFLIIFVALPAALFALKFKFFLDFIEKLLGKRL